MIIYSNVNLIFLERNYFYNILLIIIIEFLLILLYVLWLRLYWFRLLMIYLMRLNNWIDYVYLLIMDYNCLAYYGICNWHNIFII